MQTAMPSFRMYKRTLMFFRIVLSSFLRECRNFATNKGARSIMLLGVTFYAILYPVPYAHQVPQKLPVAVVDMDGSTLSRTLIRMTDATEGVSIKYRCLSTAQAIDKMQRGEVYASLVIPVDFEKRLLRGEQIVVPLYCNASRLLPYSRVLQGVRYAASNVGAGIRAIKMEKSGIGSDVAYNIQTFGMPRVSLLFNPASNYGLNTVPPVLVIILQQTLLLASAMLGGVAITRATRCPCSVLLGRILVPVAMYCGFTGLYFRVLPLCCDLPVPHNFQDFMLFLFPFLVACTCFGNAAGFFLRDCTYILAAILPTSLPFLFLSGFVWPQEAIPHFFRAIAQLLPDVPAINGAMLILMRDASLRDVMPYWMHLWGLAFLGFAICLVIQKIQHVPSLHFIHPHHLLSKEA